MPFKPSVESGGSSAPGPHHYVLAHIALRQVCGQDPMGFFRVMSSPAGDAFLQDLWRQICSNCDADGPPSFHIDEVGVTVCRIKDFPSIVVAMPPPAETAEAHFVAIVLKIDVRAQHLTGPPEVAYFTLEKGVRMDGSERTVLCGWTGDGAHVNYGDGPAAIQEAFIAAVEKFI